MSAQCASTRVPNLIVLASGIDGQARNVIEQSECLFRAPNADVPIFHRSQEVEDWIISRFPAAR